MDTSSVGSRGYFPQRFITKFHKFLEIKVQLEQLGNLSWVCFPAYVVHKNDRCEFFSGFIEEIIFYTWFTASDMH